MGRTGIIVTGLIGIVLVVGGVIAFGKKKDNNPAQNSNTTSTSATPTSSSSDANSAGQTVASAIITYSDNGFSPSTITVKSGDTLSIKNSSSGVVQVQSDPHPTHTDDPELNVGEIQPGQTGTVKATTKGTHGYHNHLNPTQTGTIIVQ